MTRWQWFKIDVMRAVYRVFPPRNACDCWWRDMRVSVAFLWSTWRWLHADYDDAITWGEVGDKIVLTVRWCTHIRWWGPLRISWRTRLPPPLPEHPNCRCVVRPTP